MPCPFRDSYRQEGVDVPVLLHLLKCSIDELTAVSIVVNLSPVVLDILVVHPEITLAAADIAVGNDLIPLLVNSVILSNQSTSSGSAWHNRKEVPDTADELSVVLAELEKHSCSN